MSRASGTTGVRPLAFVVAGFAAGLPLSIVFGESLAVVSLVWIVVLLVRRELEFRLTSLVWLPLALFAGWALLSVCWSVRPALSLSKLHRLAFLGLVPALGVAAGLRFPIFKRCDYALGSFFLAGTCLLALTDAWRVPRQLVSGVSLFDTGNMRDPQFYMAALCLAGGWLMVGGLKGRRWWIALVCFATSLGGLIVHFKRGVWMAALLAACMQVLLARKRRYLFALALSVMVLVSLPAVRARLNMLEDELNLAQGGRMALWTQAAPRLLRTYPAGMGWYAVVHDDLASVAEYVQPKLDHLHNNLLQIALELGWPGLLLWLVLIMSALLEMTRVMRACRDRESPELGLSIGVLGAFVGLLLNGLIEFNFGDTEILLLFILLMGISQAQRQLLDEERA